MRALVLLVLPILFLTSCQEGAFFEKNTVIPNVSWDYGFKPEFQVDVKDSVGSYDLYINLRHTAYYPFSNLYFFIHERGPGMDNKSTRYSFKLAKADGRWNGSSAGNLYEYNQLLKENIQFPDTGRYIFSIEQNMTENPLRGVNDVGIKLIKR